MSIGEYERPEGSFAQWDSRCAFLELLGKLAKKAIRDLCDRPLKAFQDSDIDAFYYRNEWDCIKACAAHDELWTDWYPAKQVKFYEELTAWIETEGVR